MCGIVGFIGQKPAAPLLLEGLSRLEYRGYDSAGIGYIESGYVKVQKAKGRLSELQKMVHNGVNIDATVGIGHTRWATHGKPTDVNSHPHRSSDSKFAVVHNGIIENFAVLREELQAEGVEFLSETDTEVVVHLIRKYYEGDLLDAVYKAVARLEGTYALGILAADHPDELIAVRNASPLIVGLADIGNFIASDIPAILAHTRRVIMLEDHDVVRLTRDGVEVFDGDRRPVERQVQTITWDITSAEKGGYEHFMLKEIMEQPVAVEKTVDHNLSADGRIDLKGLTLTAEQAQAFDRIFIIACGSSWHVGMVGKYVLEKLTRLPVEVDLASEFFFHDPIVDDRTLAIVISQSGETMDSLDALREAKRRGATIVSIVNVVGSTIARESDNVLYTIAGPEIAVATTKAYSTQLIMVYLIALDLAQKRGQITLEEQQALIAEMKTLPEKMTAILAQSESIKELAQRYAYLNDAYFIGRHLDYAVSLEAALKLKEISYIHAEAYAAGELKHGTISLIEEGTFVVALACYEPLISLTVSNAVEVKTRGAEVLAVTTADHKDDIRGADRVLCVPKTNDLFLASLEVVPMQLLSYYVALARGCDIDKPRNLAKSVTVR
ncbi:MAG: glutamine--fructose-6-phosphate transaminase (isomerizing) [Acutalibacteraceae bacterium]|jgi:glucosamine--fructose-6-phosphate aminotransferase (isomerizing)